MASAESRCFICNNYDNNNNINNNFGWSLLMVCFFRNTFHLKGYLVCNIQKMWLKIALVNIGHGSVLCFDASKKVQSFLELY